MAMKTIVPKMTLPTIARRCFLKRRHASCHWLSDEGDLVVDLRRRCQVVLHVLARQERVHGRIEAAGTRATAASRGPLVLGALEGTPG